MGRTRGLLWLAAGLFVALVAGLLAFQMLNRTAATTEEQNAAGPLTTVVVAARDVAVRTQIVAEDVRTLELPAASVPPGAVTSLDAAVGKLTTADLFEGEVVLSDRLLDPTIVAPDGRLALMMVEDEVLMAIPAVDILSRVRVLKPGDRVDILVSLDFKVKTAAAGGTQDKEEDVQATFVLLQNVPVAAMVGANVAPPRPIVADAEEAADTAPTVPDAVLLTLSPQDALALKYSIDAGGTLDMVLRAPGMDRPFETDAVDADYMDNRYDLPLEPGR